MFSQSGGYFVQMTDMMVRRPACQPIEVDLPWKGLTQGSSTSDEGIFRTEMTSFPHQ